MDSQLVMKHGCSNRWNILLKYSKEWYAPRETDLRVTTVPKITMINSKVINFNV